MYPDSSELTYICTLSPLFDIHLVGNESHIITIQFEKLKPHHSNNQNNNNNNNSSNSDKNETDVLDGDDEDESDDDYDSDVIDDDFLTMPVTVKVLALTLIAENRDFHRGIFLLKCLFTPFVIGALLLFCVRMYLNDLYISIPDRLLISVALAQIVQNIPTEILLSSFSDRPDSVYVKLLDDFGQVFMMVSLILFWIVYTKDKLAKNEPWERNTRYYW